MLRRLIAAVAAAAALAGGPAASARPFTIEDLLRLESFGDIVADPAGLRVVVERRRPWIQAPRFDYDSRGDVAATVLETLDLTRPGPLRPLFRADPACGYAVGPFAPDGARVVVLRLCHHQWEAGVASPGAGSVRWLGLTPADDDTARTVQWLTPTRLLVLARPASDPPRPVRMGWQTATLLPARWAAAARGDRAVTVVGSGEHLQVRQRPAAARLLLVDLESRKPARRLARGAFVDIEASPDGRHLALLEAGEDIQPGVRQALQGDWGVATERRRLAVLDLATGAIARPTPALDLLDRLLSWGPSGDRLLVYARRDGEPWGAGALQVYAPATGAMTAIQPAGLHPRLGYRPELLHTGWLGDDPIVLASGGGGTRADWWRLSPSPVNLTAAFLAPPQAISAGADGLLVAGPDGLWRVAAEGRRTPVTGSPATGIRPRRTREARLGDILPDYASVLTTDGRALRLGGGTMLNLPALPREASRRIVASSTAATAAVTLTRTPEGVERLAVVTPRGAVAASEINTRLADVPAPRVLAVRHPGPSGEPLTSWIFAPPPSARPPPLVVKPYPGDNHRTAPTPPPLPNAFAANVQMLVGHGYAVLIPSLPRPPGQTDPAAGLADRLLAIVDAAGSAPETRGAFDAQRLALWGQSFGGYAVLATLSQTGRFRAAIASAAPSDLAGVYGAFQPPWRINPADGLWITWSQGWVETLQGQMGGPPWTSPERYLRNSPVWSADRIDTPLLLLHGDQDPIALAQAEAMFGALWRQGKDAELATYWGESHFITSPGNVRDMYARAFAWLDLHLGDAASTQPPGPTRAAADAGPAPAPASGAPRIPAPPTAATRRPAPATTRPRTPVPPPGPGGPGAPPRRGRHPAGAA